MHTPGPWQVHDNGIGGYAVLNARADMRVANADFGQVADSDNARLIAAAPDLLAACEAALLRDDVADCELGDMLRAAIAKARQS